MGKGPGYFYAEGMDVGYHGIPLIQNIKIRVNPGEILTLLGPNGSGKSTILKSIAGRIPLLGGSVFLGGRDLHKMKARERARKVSVVFTDRLHGEMVSCWDVVALGRYPYTGSFGILSKKDRLAVNEAMELVQVQELKDQEFEKISDGQRQRILLARAICQEPELILLDEPTSYLDMRYKLEFLSLLQSLARKKKLMVIMSIHELDFAARISDQVLCIRGTQAEGPRPPKEVFSSGFLRELFGITAGTFDEENQSPELEKPKGNPEIFVIAGGGKGRMEFRKLQREGRPFVAGILFDQDLDYPVAKALAVHTIEARGFEPIEERLISEAKGWIDRCQRVICCRKQFGALESANKELMEYAKKQNKYCLPD
ncbi:MAG: ABC transporter ATP-binding protein [Lachnospiraceae bacterium]|jgi:iron complex transport system ATP-binding protein|nr:ABC transporter ATP-binding protein [Lachnospiraceae bacterium]